MILVDLSSYICYIFHLNCWWHIQRNFFLWHSIPFSKVNILKYITLSSSLWTQLNIFSYLKNSLKLFIWRCYLTLTSPWHVLWKAGRHWGEFMTSSGTLLRKLCDVIRHKMFKLWNGKWTEFQGCQKLVITVLNSCRVNFMTLQFC